MPTVEPGLVFRDASICPQLGKAKTRHVPPALHTSDKLAWWRWSTILACASARAFALSPLEGRATPTPTTDEVTGDTCYAGLA